MIKKNINIGILEPSQIIYEGLCSLFQKYGCNFRVFHIESIGEIEKLALKEEISIFIINPSQFQNREKDLSLIKKNVQSAGWIGLIYTFHEPNLLNMFEKSIHITDTAEHILDVVNKLISVNNSSVPDSEHEQLSAREIEVLKLIIAGLSNKEIADRLFISAHTVISHRKNISIKTGIKSQSGLTIYAISNKIVQIEDYID